MFIDTRQAPLHQAVLIEFPVLVAIGAKPLAAVVVILVGKTDGDAIAGEGPQFLGQAVIEFPRPFAGEERFDGLATIDEFRAVAPLAVRRIRQCDLGRVTAIPSVLGHAHFLDRGGFGERR